MKLKNLDINILLKDNPDGYILEVDLDYPKKLHNLHNVYHKESMLLNHCKKLQIIAIFQLAVSKILYQICVIKINSSSVQKLAVMFTFKNDKNSSTVAA